ncbi:MAG TPA: TonB family protein [Allosphingosinicella sp.]|jgi:protein TonB
MMEGAFTQQKRTNPTALAIVVLMHGAALTALALAKGEVIREALSPTKIFDVKEKDPPPPEPAKPIEKSVTPPPKTVITHVPPIIEMPREPTFVQSEPLPKIQEIVLAQPGETIVPKADPPALHIEPKRIEPARAKANLASYVSDEDYPSSAARNEEQGTTRFRLAVGPDGKVKECTVTSSSGSSALDATTCKLMKQRAKFIPAKNNRGELTSDTVTSAIRWVLPTD